MQRLRHGNQSESSSSDPNSPLNLVQSSSSGSKSGLSSRSQEKDSSSETKKRFHIRVACNSCRSKKLKCNGDRPACTACQDRNLDCVYEGDPSSTRLDNLKRKTAALEQENEDLRGLVTLLRSRPEREVESVIGRLRRGDDVKVAMASAHPGQTLSQVLSDGIDAQAKAALAARLESKDSTGEMSEVQPAAPPHLVHQNTTSSQRDKRMDISTVLMDGDADPPSKPHSRAHPPNQ